VGGRPVQAGAASAAAIARALMTRRGGVGLRMGVAIRP